VDRLRDAVDGVTDQEPAAEVHLLYDLARLGADLSN
jgi:hypothetical protein